MEQQPTRRGIHREERRFDRTFLSENSDTGHGAWVHRDYAAHFFRWGWVGGVLGTAGRRILDVGCGPEVPFAKLMTQRSLVPELYVGVDLNTFELPKGLRAWANVLPGEDFVTNDIVLQDKLATISNQRGFTDGVCFEVIEHMEVEDGFNLLANFHSYILPAGKLYLSTPVFNGKAAVNHIHEYTILELQEMIESVGFKVERRFGTFANINDIRKVCTPEQERVLSELHDYYSYEVLSCFLAPLYPDAARNNLWVLERQ